MRDIRGNLITRRVGFNIFETIGMAEYLKESALKEINIEIKK